MTGQEVYNLALSFVPELQNEVPDLDDYKIGWVNLAIAEALETENSIRRFQRRFLITIQLRRPPLHTVLQNTLLLTMTTITEATRQEANLLLPLMKLQSIPLPI